MPPKPIHHQFSNCNLAIYLGWDPTRAQSVLVLSEKSKAFSFAAMSSYATLDPIATVELSMLALRNLSVLGVRYRRNY